MENVSEQMLCGASMCLSSFTLLCSWYPSSGRSLCVFCLQVFCEAIPRACRRRLSCREIKIAFVRLLFWCQGHFVEKT